MRVEARVTLSFIVDIHVQLLEFKTNLPTTGHNAHTQYIVVPCTHESLIKID